MGLFDFLSRLFGGDGDPGDGDGQGPQETGGDRVVSESSDGTKDLTEYGQGDFREEAEEFARERADYEFDFTVASLERLDEYADSQTTVLDAVGEEMDGENELLSGMQDGFVLWFGSYFGEVLVRQFDGRWVVDEDGVHVGVPASDAELEILAFDLAAAAVNDEPRFAKVAAEVERELASDESPSASATSDADPPIPDVDLQPGVDLEAAHERTLEAFEEAGYHTTTMDMLTSMVKLEGTAKLFNFFDGDPVHTCVVHTGEWNETVTNGILNVALTVRSEMDDGGGIYVVSENEPPDAISYVSGTDPRGGFALAAMAEVQNGPEFSAASAQHYAKVGRKLLDEHFGVHIDADDADALEQIDDVVLSRLRPIDDRERSYDVYVPRAALIAVGTLAGEVMRYWFEQDHDMGTSWVSADISSTGVALQISPDEDGDGVTVNPVGKALKLYESGESDSIAFMYESTEAIVQDELASPDDD